MGENSQSTIQWGVGIICSLIMAYMLYVSGGPERSYDIVAILGMLALIAILLGYQELLVRILQVWRGNNLGSGDSSDSNGQSKRGDEERSKLTQQILKDIRREQRQRTREETNTRMETKTKTNNDEQES